MRAKYYNTHLSIEWKFLFNKRLINKIFSQYTYHNKINIYRILVRCYHCHLYLGLRGGAVGPLRGKYTSVHRLVSRSHEVHTSLWNGLKFAKWLEVLPAKSPAVRLSELSCEWGRLAEQQREAVRQSREVSCCSAVQCRKKRSPALDESKVHGATFYSLFHQRSSKPSSQVPSPGWVPFPVQPIYSSRRSKNAIIWID